MRLTTRDFTGYAAVEVRTPCWGQVNEVPSCPDPPPPDVAGVDALDIVAVVSGFRGTFDPTGFEGANVWGLTQPCALGVVVRVLDRPLVVDRGADASCACGAPSVGLRPTAKSTAGTRPTTPISTRC